MNSIKFVIGGILLLYFQILIAPKLEILNIIPNFLIAYTIFLNLKIKLQSALLLVFFIGLGFDLMHPETLGLNAFALLIIALLVNKFHQTINKQRLDMIAASVFLLNFSYYLLFLLFEYFSGSVNIRFFLIALFAVLYNSIISIASIFIFLLFGKMRFYFDA